MLLAHLSVAALTPGLPAESAGLCLAHCTLLSKTGNSKAFKTARRAGLQVPVASGEGAVCGVEGCLMKGFTKCFPECCRKVRRSSLAQILSLSQVWSQGLCLQWMAGVLAPSPSWMPMQLYFVLLCSAGFGQTVGSSGGENLQNLVITLSEIVKHTYGFICAFVGKEWHVRLEHT